MATAKRQRLDELGGEQIDSSNDQTDILDFFVEPVGAKENGDGDDFFEGLAQLEGGEASLGSTPASGPIPGDKPAADPFVASLISNGFNGTAAETGKAPLPDQQPSTAGAAANAALSKTLGTSMIGRGPAPVTTQELETLVSSLPPSYALTTKVDERELHVRLLRQLRADGPAATVLTSWVPTKDAGGRPLLRLHTVFRDRPGSLGALSLILSESGGNITEVAAHNTGDGFAVDMFSIANLERINDEMLLPHLDQRIKQALGDSNPSPRNTSVCGAYPPPASSLPPAALSSGLPGANITTNPNFTSLNPGAAGSNGSMTGAFPGATAFAMPAGGATGKIPLAAGMPVSGGVAAANAAAGMATVAAVDLGNPIGVRRTNSSCSQGSSSDVASAIASIAAAPGAAAPSPAAAAAAKVAGSEAEGSSAPLSPLAALPPLSDLVLVEEVGEGSGSKVWRGSWGNIRVAVKVLKVNPTTRKEALRGFVQEATILSQLRHPAICTLLGTCVQHGLPALVLEFMSGGSLFDLLHNSQATLTPPLLSRLALEVASGVNYLHEHSVIHRDIKSANVLLDDRMHAKVSDFGISTTFGPEHTAETGTYRCMAPEVITHQRYDHHCDVFSYGVLLWEMTHRQIPFGKDSGLQAAFAVAVERRRPSIKLPPLLEAFGTLITRAWSHEPNTRPSMQSIVVEIMVIDAKVKADCGAALRSQPPPATTQQQPGGRPSAATTAAVPQPTAALSAQPLVATVPPTGIQPPQNGASIIAPQRTAVAPAGMAAAVSCNAQATGPPALMPSNGPGLPQ